MTDDRLSVVDDYLSGQMPDDAAEAFEEALFAAPDDAEVAFVDQVSRMATYLADRGTFQIGHTRREVEALMRQHSHAVVDCGSGGTTRARLARSAELVITRLAVDLTGIERVELESYIEGMGLVKTMRDIRFDPADGELWGVCEAPLAHVTFARPIPIQSKVIGIVGGERRVLAETTVEVEFV